MRIIDLTYTIQPLMPVYPGTEPPLFETATRVEEHGFTEKKITLYSHTGTHIDAPAHMLAKGMTLDKYPISYFIGQAIVVDISGGTEGQIDIEDLRPYEGIIKECDYVLFHTGWDAYWGKDRYFTDYPVLTEQGARWLAGFNLKGLGFDTVSPDRETSCDFPIHHILFERGMVIVENLTHLDTLTNHNTLSGCKFKFCCLPLKTEQADGSPVRAIAILE